MGAAEEANRLNEENARLRDEIDKVLRERDLALGRLENEIKAAKQARMAEERARESLDELDAAIYECLPSDYDDDSPLDCVEHAADRLRDLAQERDEHKAKREEYAAEARSLRERLKDAYRERDEARAELAKLREDYDSVLEANVSLLDGAPYVDARNAIRERDEVRAELVRLNALLSSVTAENQYRAQREALALQDWQALRAERDDARAEVEHAYREGGALYEAKIAEREAHRRGAEAMREACQQWCRAWENDGEAIADALADLQVEEP